MRIKKINIKNIHYKTKDYSTMLKESIARIGFNFPIKVTLKENTYYCIDGHKRLSALHDLLENGYLCEDVPCIEDVRSHDHWREKNYH